MLKRFVTPSVSRLVLAGALVSAVMSPYVLSSHNAFAKSSKELLFSSESSFENIGNDIKSSDNALKGAKKALKDKKLKVVSKNSEDNVDLSEYDSIAYNYNDVKNDKKLQKSLQEELANGKKVYLFGGLTVKEYCDFLGIDTLYTETKMETDDSKKSIDISFFDEKNVKKEKKSKEVVDKKKDYDKHEIIGYTLNEDAPYKVFISDINSFDENGKIDIDDEIYLKEILQHENKILEKNGSKVSISSSRIVDSDYDIIASAFYLRDKVGQINSQWKLYRVTDDDDADYDYFYVKDTSTIETYNWSWDAEEFNIRHDLSFSSDELDDAEPDDKSSNPYKITLGYPFSIAYEYEIDTEPDIDLTLNKTSDYAKWEVTGSELESTDDYEFVTAWASTGTLAGIDIDHTVNFFSGISVESDADHSISISFDY